MRRRTSGRGALWCARTDELFGVEAMHILDVTPLYRIRRTLLPRVEHLSYRQRARLDKWLLLGDPNSEVEVTWHACQQVRSIYSAGGPAAGRAGGAQGGTASARAGQDAQQTGWACAGSARSRSAPRASRPEPPWPGHSRQPDTTPRTT